MRNLFFLALAIASLLFACSPARKIGSSARQNVLNDAALQTAHVGISIYDAGAGKYVYNYQGDKYFVPASNTKIPTCYAAMKYLGDSLVGARLSLAEDSALEIYPAGDPTFLHPDFVHQPLFKEIKKFKTIRWNLNGWQAKRWGSGWSWNDYDASYMAERSPFPVYGNVIRFFLSGDTLKALQKTFQYGFQFPILFLNIISRRKRYNQKCFRLTGQLMRIVFI